MQRTTPAVGAASPWEVGGVDTLALLRGFIGLAALGILLVLAFPRAAKTAAATVQYSWPASLGLGFALLVGLPLLAVLVFGLGLLVGGWWIGLMLLGLYAMLAVVAYLVFAEWIGLAAMRFARSPVHAVWALLLGLVILGVLTLIPVLGALVVLAAIIFGAGALVFSGWQAYRKSAPALTTQVNAQAAVELQAAA